MAKIVIRELSKTGKDFNATLEIEENGSRDNYDITISDPFGTEPRKEQELEWYFESWLRYPMLDNVMASRAKTSICEYGEDLFKQVFKSHPDAYVSYREVSKDLSQVTIEIESISPEFQAIHWEALQDGNFEPPASILAIQCVFSRKSKRATVTKAEVKQSPTINLLVVTARPNSDEDVAYRAISRPLVQAIRNAKLRVNIDLLRPGTYEALSNHLDAKGNGYYHIVHFDVHGSLKSYEELEAGIASDRYVYGSGRYGRDKIPKYDGVKAFLALEGTTKGKSDPVEAKEIATLLTNKNIPVCILNACQSGKQVRSRLDPLEKGGKDEEGGVSETSLGSRLMEAGMQLVVAMSYSVTVSAAKIMMQKLYESLFAEQDLELAILASRKELFNQKQRRAYYNTEIALEDWLLPVVYRNGKVDFKLREFTFEEEENYYESLDDKYEFTDPTYGFKGRELDILLIEKALLNHNVLLVRGMGGTGKTTLLNYLREWWQITNFAKESFYFGYDEKAYTLAQIVHTIGTKIYSRGEMARFQAQSLTAQWRKLSQTLKTEEYLLILDNLESVTGQALAIQNTLDEPAREEIRKFLASLVGGKTKVILGSRIAEEWLQASTFKQNSYQLRGLDLQARTDLAESILRKVKSKQSLAEIKTDESFGRLMKLLAGYPLAMEVVLANLKNKTAQEILEQLEKAEIDPGGDERTNNIVKCIDYSHSNLSEASQKLLLLLAPFRGFISTFFLSQYSEQLGKLELFQDYDLDNLETAVNEAVNWGLLSPISSDLSQFLTIQPVLPYFLNTKLRETDEVTRAALTEGFKNHYQGLAGYYTKLMESKDPQEKQLGVAFVRWEYENLYQALQICLEQQERVYKTFFCLLFYLGLIQNKSEQLKLTEDLYKKLSKYSSNSAYEGWQTDIVTITGNLGKCYSEKPDYQQAKEIYENHLELIAQFENIGNREKQLYAATTNHQLGMITQKLREFPQARDYYQQALDIKIEFGDRYSQASTLHNLGRVAQQLREFPHARDYYQQALDIYIEFGDRYEQASTLHQLGRVAQELREYPQARDYYQQALAIKIEFGDRYSQASTLNQLGNINYLLQEYPQARDYYQQALAIYIEFGDKYTQGNCYGQLGMLSEELAEWAEAKNYYLQVLDIFAEFSDQANLSRTIRNLARLYKKTQDQNLISEVATRLETTKEEISELFTKLNEEE